MIVDLLVRRILSAWVLVLDQTGAMGSGLAGCVIEG